MQLDWELTLLKSRRSEPRMDSAFTADADDVIEHIETHLPKGLVTEKEKKEIALSYDMSKIITTEVEKLGPELCGQIYSWRLEGVSMSEILQKVTLLGHTHISYGMIRAFLRRYLLLQASNPGHVGVQVKTEMNARKLDEGRRANLVIDMLEETMEKIQDDDDMDNGRKAEVLDKLLNTYMKTFTEDKRTSAPKAGNVTQINIGDKLTQVETANAALKKEVLNASFVEVPGIAEEVVEPDENESRDSPDL
jgi:hypothetical protein